MRDFVHPLDAALSPQVALYTYLYDNDMIMIVMNL